MARKSLFFLVVLAACVDTPDTGTDVAALFNDDGCPRSGCSSNSPYLGPIEFHELHEPGTIPNAEGLYISTFKKGSFPFRANVTGTTLVAERFNPVLGRWVTAYSGQALVDMVFTIAGPQGPAYEIKIAKVSNNQEYWQAPFTTLETYELVWKPIGSQRHHLNVCTNPPDDKDAEGGQPWRNVREAILFTGDRYDIDDLTVTATTPAQSGPWFNIGCFGNVMAKLVLNRHAHASQLTAAPTTWAQRQTMLKMYTSDVCGTGRAFTVQGTPIKWFAANGWESPGVMPHDEAMWNEDGVVCLERHRLHGSVNDADVEIAAECAAVNRTLAPCVGFPGYPTLSPTGPYLRTKSVMQ